MQKTEINLQFDLAVQFVNFTSQNLFLTGKAGTGKTTFLKHIRENCRKKMAVIAPTGVAAINAGGVTIHSMFQLPFGTFLPTSKFINLPDYSNIQIHNHSSLLKHMHYSTEKRQLMQELELLIIDEISMVRADLLDAIDFILKSVRRKPFLPFGGVQLVFIGDLFQLPPVVQEEEWQILSQFYKGIFFFNSAALQSYPPVYLELKKIYRQNDAGFIGLLNNIRNNKVTQDDLELLQSYYKPEFRPTKPGEFITLTTHNSRAEILNNNELKKLTGRLFTFKAEIKGEFNERSSPAEPELQLKDGAQIMFIRNDKGEFRRFYNGKIGTIKKIKEDGITIVFPGSEEELVLEKETWKNIRYQFNNDTDQIEEEELGTFTQYPIRLAWAITIHKSQGLTFEKAIVDAGESFAPGQVYVALSRLTSLDGLVLKSKIYKHSITTDDQALWYSAQEVESDKLMAQLEVARENHLINSLLQIFEWTKITDRLKEFTEEIPERTIPGKDDCLKLFTELSEKAMLQQQTTEKFIRQLDTIIRLNEEDKFTKIHARVEAGYNYFKEKIETELYKPVQEHYEVMKVKQKVKRYIKDLNEFMVLFVSKQSQLYKAFELSKGLSEGENSQTLLENFKTRSVQQGNLKEILETKKTAQAKGESQRISLELYRTGKSIAEIAGQRDMAAGTIEGHIIGFILTGEVLVEEFVSAEKLIEIRKVLATLGETTLTKAKELLGDDYTYSEIRAVMNDRKKAETEKVS